jgi:hypothetical protein
MVKLTSKAYLLPLICLMFLLSGCSAEQAGEKLEWVDKKIGEGLERVRKERQESTENKENKEKEKNEGETSKDGSLTSQDLTEEQKEEIDKWLKENNYNRYGDTAGAIYPGGTPLYNEETGESINRYDHILKKFPNILERME